MQNGAWTTNGGAALRPQELLDLRYHLYTAHTAYIHALTTFTDARVDEAPLEVVRQTGQACATSGEQLDHALTTLIQWLEPRQADARLQAECRSASTLRHVIQRELSVVHRICGLPRERSTRAKPLARKHRTRGG